MKRRIQRDKESQVDMVYVCSSPPIHTKPSENSVWDA